MMHPVDWPTVIRGIELRHHTPPIRVRWEPGFLLFEFTVLDRDTGVPIHVERAAWPAPPCYSVAEALWHVYRCLAASLDHELAEAFTFCGRRVYERHAPCGAPKEAA